MRKFAVAGVIAVTAALVPALASAGTPVPLPVQILPGVASGHLKITGSAHFSHSLVISPDGSAQSCIVSQAPGHGGVVVTFDRVHELDITLGKLHDGTIRMSRGMKATLSTTAPVFGWQSGPLRSTGTMTLTNNLMTGHLKASLWPAGRNGPITTKKPVSVVANWHCIARVGLPPIPPTS